ncbi:type III-B CRISPR module-associated protein Cmr5 [Clostridium oceanicum]|uniref:CRISPR type III-B/RAMP module-associated protein Cmr5 n=1 Tax=Clostridium oceanicum TaxID=1543 RepID=A0ABN1JJZ7_9CLOT
MDIFNKKSIRVNLIYDFIEDLEFQFEQENFKDFLSLCISIPQYIMKNGLYNTLSFMIKGKEDDDEFQEKASQIIKIYGQLIHTGDIFKLCSNLKVDTEEIEYEEFDGFLDSIKNLSTKEYMILVTNSLEFFIDLKEICENFKEKIK